MGLQNIYKTLFGFQILHRYFLDEGETAFDDNNPGNDLEDKLANNLSQYDVKEFFTIYPSKKTAQKLRNWRAIFRLTYDGFKVFMKADHSDPNKPFIDFPDELYFDFMVQINDPYFENYTDITIDRSKIVLISNRTPSASLEDTATATEYIRISDFGNAYTTIDVELSDAIAPDELIGTFAIIRVHLDGQNSDLDLTNPGGDEFNNTTPEFSIIYDNRKTIWRYLSTADNSVVFIPQLNNNNPKILPLTKNGYVDVQDGPVKYPNPNANLVVNDGGTFYSEVFI